MKRIWGNEIQQIAQTSLLGQEKLDDEQHVYIQGADEQQQHANNIL